MAAPPAPMPTHGGIGEREKRERGRGGGGNGLSVGLSINDSASESSAWWAALEETCHDESADCAGEPASRVSRVKARSIN